MVGFLPFVFKDKSKLFLHHTARFQACACFTYAYHRIDSVRDVPVPYLAGYLPPPPGFSQVFILKAVKVLCFDTLLQVFILNELEGNITSTVHTIPKAK